MRTPFRLLAAALLVLGWVPMAWPAERTAGDGIDRTETLITRTVEREQPMEGGDEWFVHTFVLDLVGLQKVGATKGRGTPIYQIVHTSEGPYEYQQAAIRRREIADLGLEIGTHFWPLSSVQRVEIRGQ